MQFQLQCARLGEQTGLDAQAKRTQVLDVVAGLRARFGEGSAEGLAEGEVEGSAEVVEGHTQALDGHTQALEGHTQALEGHTQTLEGGLDEEDVERPLSDGVSEDGFVDGMEDEDAVLDVGEEESLPDYEDL